MKRFMEITFFITFALLAVLSIYIDNLIVVIGSIAFFLLFLRAADYKPVEQSIADQPIYLTPKGKEAAIDGETRNIIPCPDTHAVDISEKVKADMESAGLPYIDPSCYKELLNTASRAASLWHSPDERPEWFPVLTFEYDNDDDPADPFNTQHYTDSTSYMHTLRAYKGYIKAWAYVDDLLKLAPIPDWWIKNAEACGNEIIKENIKKSVEEDLKNPKWEKVSIDKAGEES